MSFLVGRGTADASATRRASSSATRVSSARCASSSSASRAAYARWFPAVTWSAARDSTEPKRAEVTGEIDRSGLFGPVRAASFPWTATYTTQQYLDLLNTHSDHALLDAGFRVPLYGAIADVFERRGGGIEVPYVAVLLLTVRKD